MAEDGVSANDLPAGVWVRRGSEAPLVCRAAGCLESFNEAAELSDHLLQSHRPEEDAPSTSGGAECPVEGCGRALASREHLSRHLLYHGHLAGLQLLGLRLVEAEQGEVETCGVGSASPAAAYDGSAFFCEWRECGDSFDDVAAFADHVSRHSDLLDKDAGGSFACEWRDCDYATASRRTLRVHSLKHSGARRCGCPFCPATFHGGADKLRLHLSRKAEPGSRLICFHCQKPFSSQRLLREHCRRHLKHYRCGECEWTGETPSDLARHVRHRHQGQPSHFCPFCDKGFHSLSDLERHYTSHLAGAARFPCGDCDVVLSSAGNLSRHRRRLHGTGQSFQCHLCPAAFPLGAALGRHLKRQHALDAPPSHTRFAFKLCHDNLYRLQTHRYESPNLTTLPISVFSHHQ